MIPLVGFLPELKAQAKIVHDTAKKVFAEKGVKVKYLVGTMIELPRACIVADQIAKEAQFFSFGTNDLTQTGLGMSRDDYGSFIRHYLENDMVPKDPFQTIDFDGVGGLMKIGVEKGRATRPRPEDRHLRRARRRAGLGEVLPQDRAELRELQPVPRADRPPGGGAGGAGEVTAVEQVFNLPVNRDGQVENLLHSSQSLLLRRALTIPLFSCKTPSPSAPGWQRRPGR